MITAYIKPTNFCNINCSHCYLPQEVRANKEKMDSHTLHKVMRLLRDMKLKQKKSSVFYIWHGGEPLILQPSYFENAGQIIDEYFQEGEIIEAMQTSLLPFTERFVDLAHQRWRSEIGSSIDFSSRTLKGSNNAYFDLWLSKVELARKHGILILPTVTPNKEDTYNASFIFNWLKENDFWVWFIDRQSNFDGSLENMPSNSEHAKFLIDLYELCFQNYKKECKAPFISTIKAGIKGVLYGVPGDRWGGSCQSDFITINPDGSLNNCPDKDSFEASFGSLQDGYNSFRSSVKRKKWIMVQKVEHFNSYCSQCTHNSWCKSGCPITHNNLTFNGKPDDCSGYSSFLNHIREKVISSDEHKEFCEEYAKRA